MFYCFAAAILLRIRSPELFSHALVHTLRRSKNSSIWIKGSNATLASLPLAPYATHSISTGPSPPRVRPIDSCATRYNATASPASTGIPGTPQCALFALNPVAPSRWPPGKITKIIGNSNFDAISSSPRHSPLAISPGRTYATTTFACPCVLNAAAAPIAILSRSAALSIRGSRRHETSARFAFTAFFPE